ncbi:MAG TPA: glycosyltransferase family 4 protein [Sedimentisphaerales bacterium]|nr:glycosyltransferase family 4 protein [Sedimentisphaerales bacterium]
MDRKENATLAFCLYRYFPYGGLQRDMLRIALACRQRGHKIAVYTTAWEGEVPEGFELHVHRPAGLTNHGRMRRYHAWLTRELTQRPPACVVGFNKMPGLDVYFAADSCFEQRAEQEPRWLRLTGRYRVYAAFERAVFDPASSTEVLLIAEPQKDAFQRCYRTPDARLHLLPPWIAPDRKRVEDRPQVRQDVRDALGVAPDTLLLLQVASNFQTKGLDRTLMAMASLPETWQPRTKLAIVGQDPSRRCRRLARRLGLADHVTFLGARNNVMELMASADLLVHPARNEAAGVVLIEALVSGLPVVCSGLCGHAGHIRKAQAGIALSEPFQQTELNRVLPDMLGKDRLTSCSTHALAYAADMNVYDMPERAADVIGSIAARVARG